MAEALAGLIRSRARSGTPHPTLSLRDVAEIAAAAGATRREVEIRALSGGVVPQRYLRTIGTLGIDGQLKLRRARAAVVGAGGLGGVLVEILARLGIGALTVIDADTFTEDNLNRQLLSSEANIGEGKAAAAAERAARINSAVEVSPRRAFVDDTNADSLLAGCDLVIDALDHIPSRLVLQRAAARLKVPFIHGAIAGFAGEVMTVLPGDPGLEALYGEAGGAPEKGIEVALGTPPPTPVTVAAIEAAEAVKAVTGVGELIRNRVLFIDLATGGCSSLDLAPRGG